MRHIYLLAIMLATLLATSCADDERQSADAIPDGYGRLAITIRTPETARTRAVDTTTPWLQGTEEERAIKSYHLLVCSGNTIIDAVSGSTVALGNHEGAPKNYFPSAQAIATNIIPIGTYDLTFYCLANFTTAMMTATGLTVDSNGEITSTTLPANFETIVMQPIANGISTVPDTGLPMTGKLTQDNVSITRGATTTIADPLILWRMMAKLEFLFTNETSQQVRILGIEVDPINQASAANGSGIYLISQDILGSLDNLAPGTGIHLPDNARTDVDSVRYEPSTALTLDASGGTGNLFFYVNETDATFTKIQNQLSLRFKIQRNGQTEELRYGVTTPYTDGQTGGNGFNVIRRNDWIHIPIHLRDWQFRIEPIAFVPIAGYPATMLSSDALTATFSTGGYIILQPFAQKNNDGTWRDFSDPQVAFVSMTATGDTQMFDTAPAYDETTQRITGVIKNNLSAGTYTTTLTINVTLDGYSYSFACNVVLKK